MSVSPIAFVVAVFALAGCAIEERAPGVEGTYESHALGPSGAARPGANCPPDASGAPAVGSKSLSEPGGSVGICAANACDPNCRSYDERPPTAYATPGYTSRWWENDGGFGGSPPGFVNKLVKEPCNEPRDCGYDMHCEARKCVKNTPGWTYTPAQCSGVNLTAGAACMVEGRVRLPICNRGNTAIPAGRTIKLAIKNGDWIDQSSCPTISPVAQNCDYKLAAPLYPGTCVTADTCGWSGNAVAFVNANLAISECSGSSGAYGCSDNWSDVKVVPCQERSLVSYDPIVYTQQYVATCPIASRPRWELVTYDGTVLSNLSGSSGVKLEVQTAPRNADGSVGAFSSRVTAADTAAGDPAAVTIANAKNLSTALGGDPLVYQTVLKMTITLTPTPDNLLPATLRSWQVSYGCIPSE